MDRARDSLGNIVHASQEELPSNGFFCPNPNCGEPVFRKAGKYNRPHFAHYGHSAKPECENYHPSSNVHNFVPRRFGIGNGISTNYKSHQGGIFLECKETGSYSLWLKIPRTDAENVAYDGEIHIGTGLGVRPPYTVQQLLQTRFVPLKPKLPLVEVMASGCLKGVEANIKAYVEQFRSFGNYFKASETAGRLLATEEALEWGEHYRLLAQKQLGAVPEISGLRIEVTVWQGWHLYDITLPFYSDTQSQSERESLSLFLERTIKLPYAHAYFITPPHHIEPDGTFVFPENTECIFIRRTAPNGINVYGNGQVVINNLSDEWVEITQLDYGSFSIFLDGREELLGKIEKCELFQPLGVRLIVDGLEGEIFESVLHTPIQNKMLENLRIECPSARVADLLGLEQDTWIREECSYILRNKRCHSVDAKNFGYFACSVDEDAVVSNTSEIDEQFEAKRIWLEGIVVRFYGPEILLRLREELNNTSLPSYSEIALGNRAWLYPYIRLIKGAIG